MSPIPSSISSPDSERAIIETALSFSTPLRINASGMLHEKERPIEGSSVEEVLAKLTHLKGEIRRVFFQRLAGHIIEKMQSDPQEETPSPAMLAS